MPVFLFVFLAVGLFVFIFYSNFEFKFNLSSNSVEVTYSRVSLRLALLQFCIACLSFVYFKGSFLYNTASFLLCRYGVYAVARVASIQKVFVSNHVPIDLIGGEARPESYYLCEYEYEVEGNKYSGNL